MFVCLHNRFPTELCFHVSMVITWEEGRFGGNAQDDNWCTILSLRCLRVVVGEKPYSCGVAALGEVDGGVLADNKLDTRCSLLPDFCLDWKIFSYDSS